MCPFLFPCLFRSKWLITWQRQDNKMFIREVNSGENSIVDCQWHVQLYLSRGNEAEHIYRRLTTTTVAMPVPTFYQTHLFPIPIWHQGPASEEGEESVENRQISVTWREDSGLWQLDSASFLIFCPLVSIWQWWELLMPLGIFTTLTLVWHWSLSLSSIFFDADT